MTPTTGRIVLYTLTEDNASRINAARAGHGGYTGTAQKNGIGNTVQKGDVVPLIVVRVWPDEGGPGRDGVNGQAILDGNDSYWVTSAYEDREPVAAFEPWIGKPGLWRWAVPTGSGK
jgi:hypothetical protein